MKRMGWLGVLWLIMGAQFAFGECTKDTDCKGDRICHNGTCMAPEDAKTPVVVTPAKPAPQPAPQPVLTMAPAVGIPNMHGGTARLVRTTRAGATAGYVGAISTGAFGALSAATAGESYGLSLGSGSLALLSTVIATPIAATPGQQVRQYMRANGAFVPTSGYAIAGWTTYTLAVVNGAGLVVIGAAEEVPAGLIVSCSLLGMASSLLMAADAHKMRLLVQNVDHRADADTKKFRWMVTPVLGRQTNQMAVVGTF